MTVKSMSEAKNGEPPSPASIAKGAAVASDPFEFFETAV